MSVLVACNASKIETNMSGEVGAFEFIDQNSSTLSQEELAGDWWVAYFFYTNCRMVCPHTMTNIVNIQEELAQDNLMPPIVGFSVEPDFDTPEVLQSYVKEHGATAENIRLLTGYDFSTIQKLSNDSFKTVLDDGGPDDHAFAHSTSFFLINPQGEVVKWYDGLSQKDNKVLIEDLETLL